MTHEITGTDNWRSTITSPSTCEPVDQNAWDVPNQDIADCLVYLSNKVKVYTLTGGTVATSFFSSSSSSYVQIGSLYLDVDAISGDLITFEFYFTILPSSSTVDLQLKGSYSGAASGDIPGSEIELEAIADSGHITVQDIVLAGAFTASATGTYTLIGEYKRISASGSTDFYGQYSMESVVKRP